MKFFLHKFQNEGEIDRRLRQLAAVENHLDNFQHQMNETRQLIESSEREIEAYTQCLKVEDLEAVRNSYKVRIILCWYLLSAVAASVYRCVCNCILFIINVLLMYLLYVSLHSPRADPARPLGGGTLFLP